MTNTTRIPRVGLSTTCPHCYGELTHARAYIGSRLYVLCMNCHCRWHLSGRRQRKGPNCSTRKA